MALAEAAGFAEADAPAAAAGLEAAGLGAVEALAGAAGELAGAEAGAAPPQAANASATTGTSKNVHFMPGIVPWNWRRQPNESR
ncbi:MAG TPA: hypothetical protein VIR57_21315 [Chloroflexota bacterium]